VVQKRFQPISPLLFVHGKDDDYTPLQNTLDFLEYLTGESVAVSALDGKSPLTIYDRQNIRLCLCEQSGHAFDNTMWEKGSLFETFTFYLSTLWTHPLMEAYPEAMNFSKACVREGPKGFIPISDKKEKREAKPWSEYLSFLNKKIYKGATLRMNPYAAKSAWEDCVLPFLETTLKK
jgi:hypothetical protein